MISHNAYGVWVLPVENRIDHSLEPNSSDVLPTLRTLPCSHGVGERYIPGKAGALKTCVGEAGRHVLEVEVVRTPQRLGGATVRSYRHLARFQVNVPLATHETCSGSDRLGIVRDSGVLAATCQGEAGTPERPLTMSRVLARGYRENVFQLRPSPLVEL